MLLRSLIAAAKQDHERSPTSDKVHAVSRPVIDAQFRHSAADRFRIARIAYLQTIDPRLNSALRAAVPQAGKPAGKSQGLANFDREALYSTGYNNTSLRRAANLK
jgi:hypothetical protein